eukprot:1232041-Karenia_brevis.AAC.1
MGIREWPKPDNWPTLDVATMHQMAASNTQEHIVGYLVWDGHVQVTPVQPQQVPIMDPFHMSSSANMVII